MYFKKKLKFEEVGPDANGTLFINESIGEIQNYIKELNIYTPALEAELKECAIKFPVGLYPLRFNTEHVCFAFGSYEIPLCPIDNFIIGSVSSYITDDSTNAVNSLEEINDTDDKHSAIKKITDNLLLPLSAYEDLGSHLCVKAFINLDNQLIVQDSYKNVVACLPDYVQQDSDDMDDFDIRYVDFQFPEIRIRNNGDHHYINLSQYATARINILVEKDC